MVGMRQDKTQQTEVRLGLWDGTDSTPLNIIGQGIFDGGEFISVIIQDHAGEIVHWWNGEYPQGISMAAWKHRALNDTEKAEVISLLLQYYLHNLGKPAQSVAEELIKNSKILDKYPEEGILEVHRELLSYDEYETLYNRCAEVTHQMHRQLKQNLIRK